MPQRLLVLLALAAAPWPLAAAAPVLAAHAPGRFEVAAMDAAPAHAVAAAAEEAWRFLAGPLGLPAAFPSPVYIRLLPPGEPGAGEEHRVATETGGTVTLWLAAAPLPERALRRALADALLHRLAVALHGAASPPVVAPWLVLGAAAWWETRADGARLDALRQASARLTPPGLAALLDRPRLPGWTRDEAAGPAWLFAFLQAESGRGGEWPRLLARLLAGGDPQAMLAQAYPGRFRGAEERELWWQTGWHHLRRARVLPGLEAPESRELVGALARFVFAADPGGDDRLVPLREVVARRGEPLVAAELARRVAELARITVAVHPFYRNAALALAEALAAAPGPGGEMAAAAAAAQFERDWADGQELEEASRAVLDRHEARRRGPG